MLTTQLNHLASSAKWLSVCLWTKWLWIQVQLQSLKHPVVILAKSLNLYILLHFFSFVMWVKTSKMVQNYQICKKSVSPAISSWFLLHRCKFNLSREDISNVWKNLILLPNIDVKGQKMTPKLHSITIIFYPTKLLIIMMFSTEKYF